MLQVWNLGTKDFNSLKVPVPFSYYEGETVNLCLNIESLVVLSRTHLKLRFLNVKSEWMIVALLEFHQAISEKKSGV